MKKLSLLGCILLGLVIYVWIHGEILMRFVLPTRATQQFIEQRVEQAMGRKVDIGHIGMGWSGFKLDDVRVESKHPSEEKSLFSVKRVRLLWSPWALLTGKIKIRSLHIEKPTFHLVRYADGSFNFSDEISQETTTSEAENQEPFKLNLHVYDFRLTDGEFLFTDEQANQKIEVSRLFLRTHQLQPAQAFPISFSSHIRYAQADKPVQEVKTSFDMQLNLQDFDWSKASVNIKQWVLSHTGGKLTLKGQAENMLAPRMQLQLVADNLTEELLQAFATDVPKFSIKNLKIALNGVTDLSKKQVDISSFSIQGLDSAISMKGKGNFAQKPTFSANGDFDLDLDALGKVLEQTTDYRLTGKLQGQAQGTQDTFSGELVAQSVGAVISGAGKLSDINFNLSVPDKDHANLSDLTGKINDGEFQGSLTAARTKRGIELNLKASAPRIALPPLSNNQSEKTEDVVPSLPKESSKSSDLPPFYVKAEVDVDSLDAPFIYGEKMKFRANMGNLTSDLDKAQGTLSLNIDKGEIKDLAQLTSASIVTGALFGSLDVVGKVINSLNVLSVLNVFSGKEQGEDRSDDMIVQTIVDENGQEQHILVPYEAGSYTDIWKFKSFGTEMAFKDGVGDIKKGLFRSPRMSFNLTGNMDFNTRKLDMTVQAAPGLHEEGGVMPLTVRIGGTMEEPAGSMSMMSSMTSMLTQSVTNNAASRAVKKGIGGVVGLFKKKDEPEGAQTIEIDEPIEEPIAEE